jgi:single-stranded DNA-binding protein
VIDFACPLSIFRRHRCARGSLPLLIFSCVVDQQHQTEDSPPTWVGVATFGDLAEQITERLIKGARCYVEGRLEASIWTPDNGGGPRLNLNVTATAIAPLGQIGRQWPRQTKNAGLGQRTSNKSRHAEAAQRVGKAILRECGAANLKSQQAPQAWLDDSEAAIADVRGYGR